MTEVTETFDWSGAAAVFIEDGLRQKHPAAMAEDARAARRATVTTGEAPGADGHGHGLCRTAPFGRTMPGRGHRANVASLLALLVLQHDAPAVLGVRR